MIEIVIKSENNPQRISTAKMAFSRNRVPRSDRRGAANACFTASVSSVWSLLGIAHVYND
jgi:hypothetical protein